MWKEWALLLEYLVITRGEIGLAEGAASTSDVIHWYLPY